jgi:hypothetical protein
VADPAPDEFDTGELGKGRLGEKMIPTQMSCLTPDTKNVWVQSKLVFNSYLGHPVFGQTLSGGNHSEQLCFYPTKAGLTKYHVE